MFKRFVNRIANTINSKLSAGAILALSFILVILTGSILLSLPICQNNYVSVLDASFTAVSATCVTGLMTVNNYADFNLLGQIVVLIMIQIGGLGLMSFISIALIALNNKLDYSERSIVKDMLNKDSYADISNYLKAIVKYTLIIELIGFLLLASQLFNGSVYSLFQAFFLSISSFCNAGMDILGFTSLMDYQCNVIVNFTVISLIVLGGLGFAVWFDVTHNFNICVKLKYRFKYFLKSLKLQTKIVLIMTCILLVSGSLLTLLFEYNNALKDLSFVNKLMAALFNSVTLRTAGFYTIDNSILRTPSKIFMSVYMLIGGSPGGTAGGVKTTTIFLMFYAIYSELKGRTNMHLFNRHIVKRNFIKASTILSLYVCLLFISILILTSIETISLTDILFEACSAIGTVGLTIGITPFLTSTSKIIIMILMFAGRVGPITLLLLLKDKNNDNNEIKYPKAEIMVG